MFHLTEFISNKMVAVVPQSWCVDGRCFWPNYKTSDSVNRAVQTAEQPAPDWKSYDVRIIRSWGNYLAASRGLKSRTSCNTSDLQSEEEEKEKQAIPLKRKHMPVHHIKDSDDSEGENPPPKKARRPTTRSTAALLSVAPLPPTPLTPSPPRPRTPTSQGYEPTLQGARCGSDTNTCHALQLQMLSSIMNLEQQLQQLIGKVDNIVNRQTTRQEAEGTEIIHFPLTSVEEVELFEERIKEASSLQLKKSVISSLATIGGYDIKRITWNILARMFSDEVGKSINWKGINGKKPFSQMTSKSLLLHAVRKNHITRAATDKEILKHATRWFTLAADRGSSRRRPTGNIPPTPSRCASRYRSRPIL